LTRIEFCDAVLHQIVFLLDRRALSVNPLLLLREE